MEADRKLLYENMLDDESSVADFRLEGEAIISFPNGRMRLENALDPELGQSANFVLWCPEDFPDGIEIEWDFWPLKEPGLCMLFFAATGWQGEDLFDPALAKRSGEYRHYTHGDINALHVSYFRRKYAEERAFHTCNLRKSHGFHLVTQGADPIPNVEDCQSPYHMRVIKQGANVKFSINDLTIFDWHDEGEQYGPVLQRGKIGFRQMAPLIGEYANLRVYQI